MEAAEDRRVGGTAAAKARVRALAADLDVHEMDERRQLPPRLLERLNATGVRGIHLPVAFGGSDLGYRGCVEVIEQMAAIDVDIAAVCVLHCTSTLPLLHFGSPALREATLSRVARGELTGSLAMTEPEAGSNPRAINSRLEPEAAGDGWRLTGTKMFIGQAAWADLITVLAKAQTPNGGRLTAACVRRTDPGVEVGPELDTMGVRATPHNYVRFDDAHVAAHALLGGLGQGLAAMDVGLSFGRLTTGAIGAGAIARAGLLAHRFATRRTVATGRLAEDPLGRVRLHAFLSAHEAVAAACGVLADRLDDGVDVPPELLMAAKVAGSELAFEAADAAVQMLGGRGYVETNGAAKLLRDVRFLRIGEGATEVLLTQIGASAVAAAGLSDILDEIAPGVGGALRDAVTRLADGPWAAHGAGRLTTWALLEAATLRAGGSGPTVDWIAQRRAAASHEASLRAGSPVPAPPDERFAALASRVGTFDEVAAIPQRKLDPYLRSRPPAAAARPPIAVGPEINWRFSVGVPVDRTWRGPDGASAEHRSEPLDAVASPEHLTAVVAAWLHRLSGEDQVDLLIADGGGTRGCRYLTGDEATLDSLVRTRHSGPGWPSPAAALRAAGTPESDGGTRVARLVTGVTVCVVVGGPMPSAEQQAGVDLLVCPEPDGLALRYDPEMFDPDTIERRAANLRVLARSAAAAPDRPIARLGLLPGDELERVLHGWNGPRNQYPDELITTGIERQIDLRGEAPAVVSPSETVSYAELERRSNRIAQGLLADGLTAGATVAVCMGRIPDLVVSALAVLKAGGCFVLLDPAHPPDRLGFILEQTACGRVLASPAARPAVPGGAWTVTDVETLAGPADATRPAPRRGPGDTAYYVFTSGSTGRPKAVLLKHRNLVDQMHSRSENLALGTACTALQAAAVSFDIVAWELFGPLFDGGRVILSGEPDFAWDPAQVIDLVDRFGVNVMQIVPSQLAILLEHVDRPGRGSSLRVFVCGGETLPRALQRSCFARLPACRLQNHYGPTEATIESTVWTCIPDDDEPYACMGRPTPNTCVYILDRAGGPVPIGVPGEMTIGGPSVSGGYLGMDQLTAERFPPDPWSPEAGARMYRTGDRVRYRPDGTLEFLGRVDRQLKIRGVRLEPGEIEGALMTHPAIRRAIVTIIHRAADKRLAAYVVPAADRPRPTISELSAIARDRLPREMVPSLFAVLDALPTTATGKVDVNALPPIQENGEAPDATAVAADAIERELLAAWSEVLGRDVTSTDADFFELGGHSLLAVKVLARVRVSRDIEVSVRSFFDDPTVRGLAAAIRRSTREEQEGVATPPPPARTAPVSRSMAALRFLERFADVGIYNVPTAVRVRGHLDGEGLDAAVADLVARHEALRSRQADLDGQPVWELLGPEEGAIVVVRHDVRGRSIEEVRARIGIEASRPFALAEEPPLRVAVWQLGPEDAVLAWTVHHTVADGWSSGAIIPRDLATAYRARVRGADPGLPPVIMGPVQYYSWLAARTTPERDAMMVDAWAQVLEGAPAEITFPSLVVATAQHDHRGARIPLDLGATLSARVRSAAARARLTPFALLFAAFAVVLSRYSGERDVVVGTPLAGRNHPAVEDTVGHFVNVVPLRVDVDSDLTAVELGRRVQDALIGAVERSDVPLDQVVARVSPERRAGVNPLFQTTFALYNGALNELALPGAVVEPVAVDPGTAAFDVSVQLIDADEVVTGYLEYATARFDATMMQRVASGFARTVEAIARHPDRRLAELDYMSEDERRQVLRWGTRALAPSRDAGVIHHRIAAHADQAPQAVAVSQGSTQLTYAELDGRANLLAQRLLELGAQGTLVGLCLHRTPDVAVAMLGILKAGAAYVPLDPAYPGERLAYMLADSAARIVVTTTELADRIAFSGACLCLDSESAGSHDRGRPAVRVEPGDLAYMIYTSGSTGRPKGVEIEHGPVTRVADWWGESFGPQDRAVVVAGASICFDMSVLEILCPLMNGDHVEIAEGPLAVLDAAASASATLLIATPSAMAEMIRRGPVPPSVRVVNLGGELVPAELIARLSRPGVEVRDIYGPTETTVISSGRVRGPEDPEDLSHALPGERLYVLDELRRLVPVGAPGELCIGGIGLARGYHARPELTAERFVPDLLHDVPGARMYRTGDRMRWRPDGTLEMLGRTDSQVKVRGQRVELGEVEAALSALDGVDESAVVLRTDATGNSFLAAFVVPRAEDVSAAALAAELRSRLPSQLIPAAWSLVDRLPRTPSEKVDRGRLRNAPLEVLGEDLPPRDPVEAEIAAIWAELLGVRAGLRTSFFEAGGHSLLTMRLLTGLEQRFGVELDMVSLYAEPTIEGLARRVRAGGGRRAGLIIPLRTGAAGPAITLVHGGSGQALAFHDLARSLAYPVRAIASPTVALGEDPPPTVEQYAERYLGELLEVQEQGPWIIGGWSFGGLVAVEMARLMEQRGEDVAAVIIIDTLAPGAAMMAPQADAQTNLLVLREILGQVGVEIDGHEVLTQLEPADQIGYVLDQIERAEAVPPGLEVETVRRMLRCVDAGRGAMAAYHAPTIRAPLAVVRAADDRILRELTSAPALPTDLGWGRHSLAGVELMTSPGDHLSMVFGANSAALAAHISAVVERI
jgi:amino acid adenylation domain-containing protein